jgi:hypothetical protein
MSEFVHERTSPLIDGLMTSRISTSLCRVIFKSHEVHDAVSLMTFLQADLTVLKELGFHGASATTFCFPQVADLFVIHQPVDKIPRQKAEREAAETEGLLISSAPEMTVQETQTEIPITQPKIPSPDTAIPTPSPQATPGNTDPEQTLKGPERHRPPNHPDAPSPQPTPPLKNEDIQPPSKSVPPPPSPNIPERECSSPKPGPPRDSITPLSNIGTSYSADLSGFHLILHCI